MNSLKTMIFGPKPKAVKWLGMGSSMEEDSSEADDTMFVHPEAADEVLSPMGDQLINLIAIFGAARQGKSFLMNLLADEQDLFKISNLREPCTQGVDLSGHFLPLEKFSALNGCPAVAMKPEESIHIGFVDAEGQGDRDITYDSRLVSPVLLASKVVIFNWKDSLQADRILNLLAVLARAAQGVEVEGDNVKVFGHLHIIFRDWSFVESTPQDVYNDLFQKERGRSAEVNVRNLARVNLIEAFESINIWLFPAPVVNTANLRDKIRFDQLQRPFQEKLRELRKCISNQLRKPMRFNRQPLTARLLSQIMPPLVETLNSDQVIMPESIYSSMVRAEAKTYKDECEKTINSLCETQLASGLCSSETFERTLREEIERVIEATIEKMKAAPVSVRKEMECALREYGEKEIRIVMHANNEKIAREVSNHVGVVFDNLKRECAHIEKDLIPMKTPLLSKKCNELLQQELKRLYALPLGSQGKIAIEGEVDRIKQHANILFEKLDVSNEKALQRASAMMNDLVRIAKGKMTNEVYTSVDKRFSVKRAFTVASLHSQLEDLYKEMVRQLSKKAEENPLISFSFVEDLEAHKAHLAEEVNRRYLLEMRQVLNEIGYAAREDLGKEIINRLDGKLPMDDGLIKKEIDEAVQNVKVAVAKQLQGWTLLKSDISAKSIELEKLGDAYADDYLRKNQESKRRASAQIQEQQYKAMKKELVQEFQGKMSAIDLPTSNDHIESLFKQLIRNKATKFVASSPATCTTKRSELTARLEADLQSALENQKMLNRLASEKKEAMEAAKKEREMREREVAAARRKEQQISELKSFVEKKVGESQSESKLLREKLEEEAERAKQLMQELEEMRIRASAVEAEKREVEMRAIEEARRREQAECAAREAANVAALSADAIAAKERERQELEIRAQNEAKRRAEAESAARSAADAARLSARAAIEAATRDPSPRKHRDEDVEMDDVSCDDGTPVSKKRKRSSMSTQEGIKENSRSPGSESARKSRTPVKAKSAAVKDSARKRKSTGSVSTRDSGSLAEARRQAQEEMQRRINERVQKMSASAKKKK